jgi:hypothetical protein
VLLGQLRDDRAPGLLIEQAGDRQVLRLLKLDDRVARESAVDVVGRAGALGGATLSSEVPTGGLVGARGGGCCKRMITRSAS